jgi:hypothetical protein
MVFRFILLAAIMGLGVLGFGQDAAAPNLTITSPDPNTVVHPGDTVKFKVSASKSYIAVYLVGDDPLGVSTQALRTSSSYNLSIQIPDSTTPGTYNVTAVGALSSGSSENSNAVPLTVSN